MIQLQPQTTTLLFNGGKEAVRSAVLYDAFTRGVPFMVDAASKLLRVMFKRRTQSHMNNKTTRQKQGSIRLERTYTEGATNNVFDAILSYASDLPQTKYIRRTNTGIYIMSSNDEIEISQHVFLQKIDEVSKDDEVTKLCVEVYSYTYNLVELRSFIEDTESKYLMQISNQLGKNIYYLDEVPVQLPMTLDKTPDLTRAPARLTFTMYPLFTNKSLSNVYGDAAKVARQRVDFFVGNKRWYEEKGVPYTLGLLLTGPPGTGKTSLIKALAKDTGRHVLNVKLSETTTINQINELFYSSQVQVVQNGEKKTYEIPVDKRIVVIEDIDCLTDVVLDRQNEDRMMPHNCQLNLSVLLNILDGVLEQPGRILFMTSYFPDKLDKALIRPGRIDVIVRFSKCSAAEIAEIVHGFTGKTLTEIDKKRVLEHVWTPAEVTQVIFENLDSIENIVSKLHAGKLIEDAPAQVEPLRVQVPLVVEDAPCGQPAWTSMFA